MSFEKEDKTYSTEDLSKDRAFHFRDSIDPIFEFAQENNEMSLMLPPKNKSKELDATDLLPNYGDDTFYWLAPIDSDFYFHQRASQIFSDRPNDPYFSVQMTGFEESHQLLNHALHYYIG